MCIRDRYIPIIGGGITAGLAAHEYAKSREEGWNPFMATARASTELLPITVRDVEETAGFIDRNRAFYEAEAKKGFEETRKRLESRNLPVQSEEKQGFLSEGQQ